jgi:NitT/TauT family transport system substrate-binding protein
MKIFRTVLWLLVVFTVTAFGGRQAIAQGQPIKVTVGYTASGGQYLNLFAAKDLGVFKKHGLDVTLNRINSSSQSVASLRSGSVDIMAGPAGVVIDAIGKGITDFTFFGEAMPHTVLEVWAQPNIKTVKDLVGKTISSTNPNSLGDLMIGVWLAKNGIKKSEVHVVYLGGLANLVSAMKAHKTDATLILPPLGEQMIPSGQKRLTDLRDIPYSNQAWMATKGYAEKNRDTLARYVAAVAEAIAVVKQNKQKSVSVLPKYTGVTNAKWNAYAYDFFAPLFEKVPRVRPEVMKATQELSPNQASRTLDVTPYIDNSIVDKLAAQGFIDALYK